MSKYVLRLIHINRRALFEQLRESEGPGGVGGRQTEKRFDTSHDILINADCRIVYLLITAVRN